MNLSSIRTMMNVLEKLKTQRLHNLIEHREVLGELWNAMADDDSPEAWKLRYELTKMIQDTDFKIAKNKEAHNG